MRMERIESRALAAIRLLDAETLRPVADPITLSGEGLRILRNTSGLLVVAAAPGFADYTEHFEPPEIPPPPTPFTLVASDASRRYLDRSFTLVLPRSTTPPPPGQPLPADSVFRPVDVTLYPSPLMRPSVRSAVVRLRVEDAHGRPLSDALVSLALAAPNIERWGLSNHNGDALIPIAGIPVANWSNPEAPPHFTFSIRAAWAPSSLPPDPDSLAAAFQPLSSTLEIAAGEEVTATIQLTWANP